MKEADIIYANIDYINCPYCGLQQGGWVGDPRGGTEKCDECGETYRVFEYADIEFN